jgi:hypothetical protein
VGTLRWCLGDMFGLGIGAWVLGVYLAWGISCHHGASEIFCLAWVNADAGGRGWAEMLYVDDVADMLHLVDDVADMLYVVC